MATSTERNIGVPLASGVPVFRIPFRRRRVKVDREQVYSGVLYKTYVLNDGRELIVQYGRAGEPAAWHVAGKKTRITTEAARLLLGRIITAGEILPQRIRTRQELRPIPQCTPYHVMRELLADHTEVNKSQ